MKVKSFSHVQLFANPWTAAYQAPRSMGFSRQEDWSGGPLPSLSNLLVTQKTPSEATFKSSLLTGREIYQRRQWHPTPVLLPGKSLRRRSLVGCSHGVAKSRTRLSNFTFTFHFHALKEMASHSSVLAWRIPGMVEPGGLPSMGLHRVGHD